MRRGSEGSLVVFLFSGTTLTLDLSGFFIVYLRVFIIYLFVRFDGGKFKFFEGTIFILLRVFVFLSGPKCIKCNKEKIDQ
jgi:hypothetical protein